MIPALVLSFALLQVPSADTVALVFADRTEIVTVQAAEREHAALAAVMILSKEQEKRHAALVQALGSNRQAVVECKDGKRTNLWGEVFICGN